MCYNHRPHFFSVSLHPTGQGLQYNQLPIAGPNSCSFGSFNMLFTPHAIQNILDSGHLCGAHCVWCLHLPCESNCRAVEQCGVVAPHLDHVAWLQVTPWFKFNW